MGPGRDRPSGPRRLPPRGDQDAGGPVEGGEGLNAGADAGVLAEPPEDPSATGDAQPTGVHDRRRTPGLERLFGAIGVIGKRWEQDRSTARELYSELMAEGPARRAELLATDRRFASPALVEELLAEAGEASRNRPAAAREHAELASAVIEQIEAGRFGGGAMAGLRVAAQARKAEALWWSGDSRQADAVLLGALDDVEETPTACMERALYCRITALVRAGQGRSDEALALFGRASQLYHQEEETAALGECLVERGWLLAEADPGAAIPPFQRALSLIDPVVRPWEALRVRQGLAFCHAELGNGSEAESMLGQSRKLRERLSEEADFLRATQTEGQIEARLGHHERAMGLLRLVLEGWLGRGEAFLAALSVIDLAEIYGDEARWRDLAALEETSPRLRAAGLPSEAAVAVRVVMKLAARQGDAAACTLTHLRDYLSRALYDHQLPYTPSRPASERLAWDELPPERRRAVCERVGVEAQVGDRAAAEVPANLRKLIGWSYQEVSGVELEWDGLGPLRVGLRNLIAALLVVQGEIRAIGDLVPVPSDLNCGDSGGEGIEANEAATAWSGVVRWLMAGDLEHEISRLKGVAEGQPDLDPCG
jgi:tetratricopeptide (TPR) repeat protein